MKNKHGSNVNLLEERIEELKVSLRDEKRKARQEKAKLRKSGHEVLGKTVIIAIENGDLDADAISGVIQQHVVSKKDKSILKAAGLYKPTSSKIKKDVATKELPADFNQMPLQSSTTTSEKANSEGLPLKNEQLQEEDKKKLNNKLEQPLRIQSNEYLDNQLIAEDIPKKN